MKSLVIVLIGILFAPAVVFADDAKPAEEKQAAKKKAEAKAEADPSAKAQQALETLEALGKVVEVFGAVLGGRPVIGEAIAAEAVVAGEVLGDPLEQQFLQQFRQLSKTELNFVRTVCQPNAEQSQKIKAAGDVGLKTAVKKFAEIQKKMQQGMRAGEQPGWPDPRKLMELSKAEKREFTLLPGIPGVGEVVDRPFGKSNLEGK